MVTRADEYDRINYFNRFQRQAERQLEMRGTLSYSTQMALELFKERTDRNIYESVRTNSPLTPSRFSIKKNFFINVPLKDYYAHPVDIDSKRQSIIYLDASGDILLDSFVNETVSRSVLPIQESESQEVFKHIHLTSKEIFRTTDHFIDAVDFETGYCDSNFIFSETDIRNITTQGKIMLLAKSKGFNLIDLRAMKSVSHFRGEDVLKILPDFPYLVTGENSSAVKVYDIRKLENPIYVHAAHRAGVRALCWDAGAAGYFYSGGGADDRTIKRYSVHSEALKETIQTDAQVLDLHSLENNHLISVHGFAVPRSPERAHNVVSLWKRFESGLRLQETVPLSQMNRERPLFSKLEEGRDFYVGYGKEEKAIISSFKLKIGEKNGSLGLFNFNSIR